MVKVLNTTCQHSPFPKSRVPPFISTGYYLHPVHAFTCQCYSIGSSSGSWQSTWQRWGTTGPLKNWKWFLGWLKLSSKVSFCLFCFWWVGGGWGVMLEQAQSRSSHARQTQEQREESNLLKTEYPVHATNHISHRSSHKDEEDTI